MKGKSNTRARRVSHLHSSHQVLFGLFGHIYLFFKVSFPEVYFINFYSGNVYWLRRIRHSLVETGSGAVLMTMAFKCPEWTIHKAQTD